jgi:hypothetical protein
MTEDSSDDRLGQKAALQQEFEQLLNIFFTGECGVMHDSTAARSPPHQQPLSPVSLQLVHYR